MKSPASRDARGARCNKHDNKQGYHRDTKAVLTLDNAELTTPATQLPTLLVPPDPRQRDGRPVVALRRMITHIILISLVVRHGASFMVQDHI